METKYLWFATTDGDLMDDYQIRRIARIVHDVVIPSDDHDAIRAYAKTCKGITHEVKHPSVDYLLKHGHKVTAMRIYRNTHPDVTLLEARQYIESRESTLKANVEIVRNLSL